MNFINAMFTLALAGLVVAQTDADHQPLMTDYMGLSLVVLGLVISAHISLYLSIKRS